MVCVPHFFISIEFPDLEFFPPRFSCFFSRKRGKSGRKFSEKSGPIHALVHVWYVVKVVRIILTCTLRHHPPDRTWPPMTHDHASRLAPPHAQEDLTPHHHAPDRAWQHDPMTILHLMDTNTQTSQRKYVPGMLYDTHKTHQSKYTTPVVTYQRVRS